jgi:hypothetical protein
MSDEILGGGGLHRFCDVLKLSGFQNPPLISALIAVTTPLRR